MSFWIFFTIGVPPMPPKWPAKGARQPRKPVKPAKAAKAVETPLCFNFHCIYRLQQIHRPLFSSHTNFFFADVYISVAGSTFCLEDRASAAA